METKTESGQPGSLKGKRPAWMRMLLWAVAAFFLVNALGVALIFISVPGQDAGMLLRLALVAAVVALPLWRWHGMDVLRTWGNPATARFTRHDDPATGGIVFDVSPARATRMPALPLFAVGVFLLLMAVLVGSRSTGAFIGLYIVATVCIGVGCSFVLPGARDRKPVKVSVSKHGVQSGDIGMPLGSVADLRVTQGGLVVDPDPLMPVPGGVPIASIAGRHMGRRQSARGYAVTIRADGESQSSILAGGLTEDCARALVAELGKAIKIELARPADAPTTTGVTR